MRPALVAALLALAACGPTFPGDVSADDDLKGVDVEAACSTTCRNAGYDAGIWCNCGTALMVCVCHGSSVADPCFLCV